MASKDGHILKEGNDPDCVHHERINNDIGICLKCGRVKKYADKYRNLRTVSAIAYERTKKRRQEQRGKV